MQNSMTIKVANCHTLREKLKAILLIQIKVMVKYQDFMTIVLTEVLGKDARNLTCRKYVFEYIDMLENIIRDSINDGETDMANLGSPSTLATSIFGTTYSILLYKIKSTEELDIKSLYKEYVNMIFTK